MSHHTKPRCQAARSGKPLPLIGGEAASGATVTQTVWLA